ncbi:MAG: YraN family protein [Candidatus Kerfeldbacteria bacterium]|nr:YraN family protein [Candidatus Kerfeldbacteria bacterium]
MTRQTMGAVGEEVVVRALKRRGFDILGRNLHTRSGEIDILALEDGAGKRVLHVIEVKTRRGEFFGGVETALTRTKFQKMKLALYELQEKMDLPSVSVVQFDFAALEVVSGKQVRLKWFWNIGGDDFH